MVWCDEEYLDGDYYYTIMFILRNLIIWCCCGSNPPWTWCGLILPHGGETSGSATQENLLTYLGLSKHGIPPQTMIHHHFPDSTGHHANSIPYHWNIPDSFPDFWWFLYHHLLSIVLGFTGAWVDVWGGEGTLMVFAKHGGQEMRLACSYYKYSTVEANT